MYTNKGNIQNYLLVDIDSSFDTQISNWITAAENYINKYTNRPAGFEGASTTKYYDGNGESDLIIDDFTGTPTVKILELYGTDVEYTLTEGMDNDYVIEPYNEDRKYKLKITPNSQVGYWLQGPKRIQVTATFGYATLVPKDIGLVATMLVAGIIEKGLHGGTGKITSERLGDYAVSYADIDEKVKTMGIKQILDNYKLIKV